MRCLTKEYGQSWDHILSQEKYTYNDTINRTSGKSPSEVVYGVHPRGIIELKNMKISAKISGVVEEFSLSIKEVHDMVKKTFE